MPSPQNASYTPPTTTPFSSPTDHSRLHRGTTTSPCPRLSLHPPAFASLLMLPWVLHTSHATILYHFGVSRTLSMLMRFYYWIRMDISTRWWLPLRQVPGAQDFAPNNYLAYAFHSATERRRHSRQRRLFDPLPTTPRGNYYVLLFTDRVSRHADMYATTEPEFTASGAADILDDRYIPFWGLPSFPTMTLHCVLNSSALSTIAVVSTKLPQAPTLLAPTAV